MTKFVFIAAVSANLFLAGCAHGPAAATLDEKVSEQAAPKGQIELAEEARNVIDTAPGLSDDQRFKLRALRDSFQQKTEAMREETLKLRAVLIKDVVATEYKQEEIDLIENRINSLEKKRVTALFSAVKAANAILGHQAVQNPMIMKDFIDRGSRRLD